MNPSGPERQDIPSSSSSPASVALLKMLEVLAEGERSKTVKATFRNGRTAEKMLEMNQDNPELLVPDGEEYFTFSCFAYRPEEVAQGVEYPEPIAGASDIRVAFTPPVLNLFSNIGSFKPETAKLFESIWSDVDCPVLAEHKVDGYAVEYWSNGAYQQYRGAKRLASS